jgi:O-antigen/teichoic acid export membrane protein
LRFRQLLKEFLIYGLGDLLLRAATFITLPIYTRLLSTTDYGMWSYTLTAVGLFSGFLALGGDSAYARYFFEVKTLPEKQAITTTWLSFLAGWSLFIILGLLPWLPNFAVWSFGSEESVLLFTLALLTTPVNLLNQLCGQVLRNEFQAKKFTTLNMVTTLITIGFSLIGVVVLDFGVAGILGGALVAALCMLPIRLWTVRRMLRLTFSFYWLRQLLSYGVPLVPVSVAYWIFVVSDRLVIGKLSTIEELGLYAVANNLTSTLTYANSALGQALSPHSIRVYEEQRESAPQFYGRVMTYILLGFGLLCVTISTFAHEALLLLSTPPFYPAAVVVGPLALAIVALASTQVTAASISITKKTYYLSLYSWLAALLNLGLNLLFVPRWGMMAAGWTTAIAYIFLTVGYMYTSQRLWPIAYETRRSIIITCLTILFTLVATVWPAWPLAVSIPAKLLYVLGYIGCLLWLGTVDQGVWQLLRLQVSTRLSGSGKPAPPPTEPPASPGAAV